MLYEVITLVGGIRHRLARSARRRRAQVRKNRLAGDHRLTNAYQRNHALGKINVQPRAEPDQPEPLAGRDRVAGPVV